MTTKEKLLNTIKLCIEKNIPLMVKQVNIEKDYFEDMVDVKDLNELYEAVEKMNDDVTVEEDNVIYAIEDFYPMTNND